MVLDKNGENIKQAVVTQKTKVTVDLQLSELNQVVKNCEEEIKVSLLNQEKERGQKLSTDFINMVVDIRMSDPAYDYIDRIKDKLQDIRDLRTREKRYKDE